MNINKTPPAIIRQQALAEVKALRQAGQHAESLTVIERILDELPWHPELAGQCSESLRHTGQYERALQVIDDAIAREPTPWLYMVKATTLAAISQFERAFTCLDSAPDVFQSRFEAQRENLNRQKAVRESQKLREAGSFDLALANIQKSQKDLPTAPIIIAEHATCLLASGEVDESLAVLNSGIALFPGHLALLMSKAHLFFSQERFSDAIETLKHPDLPVSFAPRVALLARIEFQTGDRKAAIALAATQRESQPCANVYAELLRRSGDAEEALSFIRQSKSNHVDWPFRIQEALCLEVLGHEETLNQLLKKWQSDDSLPKAYYLIVIRQRQRQFDYRGSIEWVETALKHWPDDLELYRLYLQSAIQQKDTTLTIKIMDTLHSKYFDKVQCQQVLATAWSLMGDHQQALTHLQRAVSIEPTKIASCVQYIDKLVMLGESKQALVFLDNCPDSIRCHELLLLARVKIYWSQGEYENAVDVLKAICVVTDLKPGIANQAIESFLEMGYIAEARVVLDRMDPGIANSDLQHHLALAKVQVAERKISSALATLETLRVKHPHHVGLLNRLAQLKLSLGNISDAEQDYKAILSLKLQQNKAQAEKYTTSMLGQQINEFKLLSYDMSFTDDHTFLGQQIHLASDNTLLAITVIRKLYELDQLPPNIVSRYRNIERKIPLKIFQYWNTPEAPDQIQQLMDQCRIVNADCEYTRFYDLKALKYLKEKGLFKAARAFQVAREPATKADILRLALLWCEGGVYLDADDLCCKPFSQYLDPEAEIYLYVEPHMYSLGNNFMASKPKSPMMEAALQQATDSVLSNSTESTWFSTGPALVTRCFVSHYVTPQLTLKKGAVVLLIPALRRFLAHHQRVAYKQTNQHWVKSFSDRQWNVVDKLA